MKEVHFLTKGGVAPNLMLPKVKSCDSIRLSH